MARTQACWFNDSTDCSVNDYITQPVSLLKSCWKYLSPKDFLSFLDPNLKFHRHPDVFQSLCASACLRPLPSTQLALIHLISRTTCQLRKRPPQVLRDQRLQNPVLCALVWAPHLHKPHSYSSYRASFPNTIEEWPTGGKWTGSLPSSSVRTSAPQVPGWSLMTGRWHPDPRNRANWF